jgi:FtsP/CotA-like multicopper oxidase with cupredoxin domain
MKLPAKADGGPHQPIAPNQTWQTKFDIIQSAATLWYHSHPQGWCDFIGQNSAFTGLNA